MAARSWLRLLFVAAASAALGCLWISALLWRPGPVDDHVGISFVYVPILVWSVWVFVVALRGGLVRGITLAAVSAAAGFAGGYLGGVIWVLSVELGP